MFSFLLQEYHSTVPTSNIMQDYNDKDMNNIYISNDTYRNTTQLNIFIAVELSHVI